MKTRLLHFLILLLGFQTSTAFSQEPRFIEIVATDTVSLKATQIVYEITMGGSMDYLNISMPPDVSDGGNTAKTTINDVTRILTKEKFMYEVDGSKDYTISDKKDQSVITVTLKNETELKKLIEAFKDLNGISGRISTVSYEPLSMYREMLFKRLYAKALKEANMLGAVSGNMIGRMISAKEVADTMDTYTNWYTELLKNMPYSLFPGQEVSKKVETVKFAFKFELK